MAFLLIAAGFLLVFAVLLLFARWIQRQVREYDQARRDRRDYEYVLLW